MPKAKDLRDCNVRCKPLGRLKQPCENPPGNSYIYIYRKTIFIGADLGWDILVPGRVYEEIVNVKLPIMQLPPRFMSERSQKISVFEPPAVVLYGAMHTNLFVAGGWQDLG